MEAWRRLGGRVVLVFVVFGSGYLGARFGIVNPPAAQASHNFPDVPDGYFAHDFVDFLVNNGITSGCQLAPPLFCPEQPVTRGQTAVFLEKLASAFEIVHHFHTFPNTNSTVDFAPCPAGKRPLSGGGSIDAFHFFITDIIIESTGVTVRWESDNGTSQTGSTDVWALCAPA
jgi:hypothetical protein